MKLQWKQVSNTDHATEWVAETGTGKYRFVITEAKTGQPDKPFYGRLNMVVDNKHHLLESGHYKTWKTAENGLKRKASGYRIDT